MISFFTSIRSPYRRAAALDRYFARVRLDPTTLGKLWWNIDRSFNQFLSEDVPADVARAGAVSRKFWIGGEPARPSQPDTGHASGPVSSRRSR